LQPQSSQFIVSVTTDTGGKEVSNYGWDENKEKSNFKKHKISFKEAIEVFQESHIIFFGEDISENYPERRYCAAGISKKNKFIYIVYEDWEEIEGSFTHVIHCKEFERSHLKHFTNPHDQTEIEALLKYFKSPRNG
jgi:uncharacterized protein